ncbi:G-protein coupled receptor 54-like [Strongylocentrotus purpuratus]|uniref:G-protein coupled receptors family 1 profile domain-containing protein n=1 Tax=Strongylocentrotus purpuratus TaxID=7668 RepID=A0A7M7NM54_STRPU|nr:G-protein coupled receptor 54-like [Strongylocentrotus purpuratus]
MMRLPYPPPMGMGSQRNMTNMSSCGYRPADCDYVHDFYIVALPLLVIIIVIGFVTNLLVLYIIVAYKTMRTVPNCYAANICITDIIFLIMASITDVAEYARGVSGMAKSVIPRSVSVYFHLVLTNATCAMLCALAFDRYLAIVHPFRFKRFRTVKFAFIIGVVAWFVSFAVCTPIYAGELTESTYEAFTFHDFVLAIIISCIFSYVLPLMVIACCYVTILCSLFSKASSLRGSSSSSNGLESRMLKRNLAVLKSILIIALVFALNYGVFYAVYLWLSLCAPQNFRKVFTASHVASLLECVGLCLNPIIYGLMQPNFRPYLKDIRDRIKERRGRCCQRGRAFKEVNSNAITMGTKETSLTESKKDHLETVSKIQ